MTELAEAINQYPVAGRKGIRKRDFPTRGAGCREDKRLSGSGLKNLLQIFKKRFDQLREIRRPMVRH